MKSFEFPLIKTNDFRFYTGKQNNIRNKNWLNRKIIVDAGEGPPKYCSLTALKLKVVKLLSMDTNVIGMTGPSSFGTDPPKGTDSSAEIGSSIS